jgi:hypothetical protein
MDLDAIVGAHSVAHAAAYAFGGVGYCIAITALVHFGRLAQRALSAYAHTKAAALAVLVIDDDFFLHFNLQFQ